MKAKSLIGSVGCAVSLVALCVIGFAAILTAMAVQTAMQLPFGRDQALSWILGTPQAKGSWGNPGVGIGMISVGFKVYKGVVINPSFLCSPLIYAGKIGVSDSYGSYRGANYIDHPGIDIGTFGKQGYDVVTPWGGEVVFVGFYALKILWLMQ